MIASGVGTDREMSERSTQFLTCDPLTFIATTWAALRMSHDISGYPTKPIRLVIPFPPGGPNDIVGRLIAQKLSEAFGQQVVPDNRGGASGIIAAQLVAGAVPDGYTLLLGGSALLSLNSALFAKLPYEPLKDFAPVSLVASGPFMLVTHPKVPVKTVQDLIKLARAKPGQLNFASPSVGGPARLATELFKSMADIDLMLVPYNGGGQAQMATVAGEVHLYFSGIASVLPLVRESRLRGIAVTSARRTPAAPEFPTIAESGLPGYEISSWFAIVVPAKTSKPVIARLNSEIVKAINAADTRKRFVALATDPIGSTPEELAAYNRSELVKWTKVIKSAGIKLK